MLDLNLYGTPDVIIEHVASLAPEVREVLYDVRSRVLPIKPKREIYEYQAACLYVLAKQYNRAEAHILEIGTALGYSAAIIASAAPAAHIVTLNPKIEEANQARLILSRWPNVQVDMIRSWDYLQLNRDTYDMIFVDGDHAHVAADLPWWFQINQGGLFLFHDYSPAESGRPCPPVYEAVNEFSRAINQALDVCIVDDQKVGLAGFYRKAIDPVVTGSWGMMQD